MKALLEAPDLWAHHEMSQRALRHIQDSPEVLAGLFGIPGFEPLVAYLRNEFRERARKVTGHPAILHFFRVAGLVREAGGDERVTHLALCHDTHEDMSLPPDAAKFVELGVGEVEVLLSDIDRLTRREAQNESYLAYMRRVADPTGDMRADRAVLMVKSADMFDNLLDLRAGPDAKPDEINLYRALVEALFSAPAPEPAEVSRLRDEARMFAVWKALAFLSRCRETGNPAAQRTAVIKLQKMLLQAAENEALRIVIDLLRYRVDMGHRVAALAEILPYCQSESLRTVTPSTGRGADGLCETMHRRSVDRQALANLQEDAPRLFRFALGLLAALIHMRNDPGFFVRGLYELDPPASS